MIRMARNAGLSLRYGARNVRRRNTRRARRFLVPLALLAFLLPALAQIKPFTPVTQQMLVNPKPDDWLMYSRTYDAQRYSPLKQISRENVGKLQRVWSNDLPDAGTHESIPIVYDGVMYVVVPGGAVHALDA